MVKRFVIPLHVLWPRAGTSPRDGSGSLRCALTVCCLRFIRPLLLPGLPVGFQVAATGYEKVSTCEVHPTLMAIWKLTSDIHDGARLRPWIFSLSDEAEKSATHDGSAQGLFRGLVFFSVWARFVPFFHASLLFWLPWAVCVFGAVCGRLVLCPRASFSMALLSCGLMTRFKIASQLQIKGRRPMWAFSSPRHLG